MNNIDNNEWAYVVRHLVSKEELVFDSLGAISRKLGIPRTTLYDNLSDPADPVYRHKEHLIERIARG